MNNTFFNENEPTVEELNSIVAEEEEILAEETYEDDGYCEDSLRMYLRDIGRIKVLTVEEEQELGRMMAAGGSKAKMAKDKLIESNLKLVMHYAKKYVGRGVDLEDLNSMGIEGLYKAVERFDYTLGFKFSTYASWWIKQSITRGISEEADMVRVPVHMNETINKIKKAQRELAQKSSEEPSVETLAEYTGLSTDKIMSAFDAMYRYISFDTPVGEDGDGTFEECIADDRASDPCEMAIAGSLRDAVRRILKQLSPREAMVLTYRFGLDGGSAMTLEEVGAMPGLGVTRERVRQIETKAINKIKRSPSMRNQLEDYLN